MCFSTFDSCEGRPQVLKVRKDLWPNIEAMDTHTESLLNIIARLEASLVERGALIV